MRHVHRKFLLLLIGLCVAVFGTLSRANPITLTGADLLSSPDVSFPTVQPTLNGDSLVFGAGQGLDKLFVLPLNNYVSLLTSPISISINLTRLPCSGSCAWGQVEDWEPGLFLSDGTLLFGFRIGDTSSGWTAMLASDAGNRLSSDLGFTTYPGADFPAIGESVEVNALFTLQGSQTILDISFLTQSGSHTTTTTFDINSGLSLVFARDNDGGEQYQVNSITLYPNRVPEPSTTLLLAIGLLGLAAVTATRSPSRI